MHTLVDHRLYLPSSWTEDADRLAAAGVPEQVESATKPELARQMAATDTLATPRGPLAVKELDGM